MNIKVFTARDIDRALSMAEAVEVVKDAFVQLSLKKAQSPVRTSLSLKEPGGAALVMPAYLEESGALGAKMVTVLPWNPRAHLPAVQAMVFLFDAATGSPLAVLEGTHLTRFRTGAATGAATQVLSRPESACLAVFGAGGQSFFQVKGVLAARKIGQVKVFDLLAEKADELIDSLRKDASCRGVELLRAQTPAQALEGTDIVVTATTSSRPVFDGRLVKEGMHINAIGAFKPEMQEVDEETIRRSRIFVDSVEACLEEAGDLIVPLKKGLIQKADILAELGEVAAGKKAGRGSAREITYFKSVGNAVQDVSVAQAVYRRSREKGLGQEVEF
ncbi:MAG: ornithine cyclodeaminase family protein [Syntrophaceae bacterium]|nr:ornithine cyclodeaminase family protein [Syntrophaceae bacterium]